ncbi:hypothetical protein PMAYCL1PPCAC_16408, partial [Pristionchus mayeri]
AESFSHKQHPRLFSKFHREVQSGINCDFVIPLQNVTNSDMQLILNWLQGFPPHPTEQEVETRHNSDNKYCGRTQIAPLERRFFEALPTANALFGML